MIKISKYVIYDILRSKVIIAYTLFLFLISIGLFVFQNDISKSIISIMSIIMIMVPLVSIVFSTTYFYNGYEFIELLIAQPMSRRIILMGEFMGIAISLVTAFIIGVGVPIVIFSATKTGAVIIISGITLTLIFISLAVLGSVATRDKAKGIGIALMLWFYFSIIYDAMILGILFVFSDYPLDKAVIVLASLNPIDLGRIIILLKLDISALMGFTGAVYKQFFGSSFGLIYTMAIMILWIIIPMLFAIRIFMKKNL